MAKTDRLFVRIDRNTKMQAVELFDTLGISVTDAVTLFIQHSLASGSLPFNVDNSLKNKNVSSPQAK